MRHLTFGTRTQGFSVALLVKDSTLTNPEIEDNYINPYVAAHGDKEGVIALTLDSNGGKPSAKFVREQVQSLYATLLYMKIGTLWIADAAYFKAFTGKTMKDCRGHVTPSKEHSFSCIPIPNYRQAFHDDRVPGLIAESIRTLISHQLGVWQPPGKDILRYEYYPEDEYDKLVILEQLKKYPALAVDIEAFSLRFNEAGIGTIAFAWDSGSGVAFSVDYSPKVDYSDGLHGEYMPDKSLRESLRDFFLDYKGKLIWQNGYGYDIKVLIYVLFMRHPLDTEGLLEGLRAFYWSREYHDTQIITYLATNSTGGNTLGLKENSAEYAGQYAEDVEDIRKIPLPKLLKYNLTDAASTWFVFDKHYPLLPAADQLTPYETIFLPSMPVLTQTMLTGMPMDMSHIKRTQADLEAVRDTAMRQLTAVDELVAFRDLLAEAARQKDFADRKAKAKNPDKLVIKPIERFDDLEFNPNSGIQVGKLLHEYFGLEIHDRTDTGLPSTSGDSLSKLRNLLVAEHAIKPEELL